MGLHSKLGMRFSEHMGGTFTGLNGDLKGGSADFYLDVDCNDMSHPVRDIKGTLTGSVSFHGLAENAVIADGFFSLSPIWKRKIGYAFSFEGDDGKTYLYEGAKRIKGGLNLLRSFTTLPGRLFEEESGDHIANVLVRFDMRQDGPGWFFSFRPQLV